MLRVVGEQPVASLPYISCTQNNSHSLVDEVRQLRTQPKSSSWYYPWIESGLEVHAEKYRLLLHICYTRCGLVALGHLLWTCVAAILEFFILMWVAWAPSAVINAVAHKLARSVAEFVYHRCEHLLPFWTRLGWWVCKCGRWPLRLIALASLTFGVRAVLLLARSAGVAGGLWRNLSALSSAKRTNAVIQK